MTDDIQEPIDITSTSKSAQIIVPITAITNDKFRLQIKDDSGTSDVLVQALTIVIQ